MLDNNANMDERCQRCGMLKFRSSGYTRSWYEEHEMIVSSKGVRVFCFRDGDTAETFWEYLRSVLVDLEAKSCTSSAINSRRAPEWVRLCAMEEMYSERNLHKRERYEKIANFCKRRAYELAPALECLPRLKRNRQPSTGLTTANDGC